MELWPWQVRGLQMRREAIASGVRRICYESPTGMGKGRSLAEMVKESLEMDRRCLVITNRRLLIDQLSSVLQKQGIYHGMRAAEYAPNEDRMVQISSLQTEVSRVIKRKSWDIFPADDILIDEAHINKAASAVEIVNRLLQKPGSTVTGFSGTPIELAHMYDVLLSAGTKKEGRDFGALVYARHLGIDEPDMSRYKPNIKTGEYKDGDIVKAIMTPNVFGRIWDHWCRFNPDRKRTILFAPSVKHSVGFAEEFQKRGVRSAHIDGENCWIDGEYYPSSQEVREQILGEVRKGDVTMLSNRFVCLDDKTEILTDAGWVGLHAMTKDHNVANWDDGNVFFAKPKKIIVRDRQPGEDMVVLETPRRSIRVTGNHELLYRTTNSGRFLKKPAIELAGKAIKIPVSGIAEPFAALIEQEDLIGNLARRITSNSHAMRRRGFDPKTSRDEAKKRILDRAKLRRKQPCELTLDECELIGFWIGDGNIAKLSRGGVEYRMWQGIDCPSIIDRVDELLSGLGIHAIKKIVKTENDTDVVQWSMCRGTGYGNQKRSGIYHLEPYLDKHGSDYLWGLNKPQIDSLIKGLWMADGTQHNDNTDCEERLAICSARKSLVDKLQAICVCRGYRASVRKYNNGEGLFIYHLTLSETDCHAMSKYRLEIENDVFKSEKVWCVETDSGNIITRRNGSATVMGNCREGVDLPMIEVMILATVIGSLQSYLQVAGRALRASKATGKQEALILDHSGSYWRHGSVNADRAWDMGQSEAVIQGMRAEAIRNKQEPEPVSCPKCFTVRNGGTTCPSCGFRTERKSRMVVQQDGSLVEYTGDIFRPRKTQLRSDTIRKWEKCYWSAKRSGRTFRQAIGWFYQCHGYFPPADIPLMPLRVIDGWSRVADVRNDMLTGVVTKDVELFK